MKKFNLLKTMMLLCMLFVGMTALAETYKLQQVSSVAAGEKYVFVQDTHAFGSTVSNSSLQTVTGFKTTGLIGNEAYVWTLETATGGFYMKNVSLSSNAYLNNPSKTNISLSTASSIWTFDFENPNAVLIQNKSNSSRFLGYSTATSYVYKAYATTNLSEYPHAIKVYKLVEEGNEGPVGVTGVTLDKTELSLGEGKSKTLTATVVPANATNMNVTWTSSNTRVATVADGVVTAVKEGNATITVTTEDGNHTATCDVTVTPFTYTYANTYTSGDGLLTTTGGTSTSQAKVIWDGEEYAAIKAGTGSSVGAIKVTVPAGTKTLHMHIAGWKNDCSKVNVSGNGIGDVNPISITPDAGVSSNSPFTLQSDPETTHYYSIDTNNTTAVTITIAATVGNRFVLFGVNAEAMTETVAIGATGYATYYNAIPYTMPAGLQGVIMEENGSTHAVVATTVFKEGDVVPAQTALVLKGTPNTDYTLTYSNATPDAVLVDYVEAYSLLKGTLVEATTTGGGANAKYYKLADGANGVGWYYGSASNTTGAAFTIGANKAYLVVEGSAAKSFIGLDEDETTGISTVETINENAPAYNLAGQRVNANAKGIVIINGKKYLNK